MSLSKLCRSRSSVALETLSRSTLCELSSCMSPLPSPNSVIQKPCPPAPHIAHLATAPRLSHASRRLRLGPAPSDGASCNSTSPLARKPLTPLGFPKRKSAPKKKVNWADVVARRPLATQDSLRTSRRMPAPLAMWGSSTDAARIKREQAAKRAQDEKPCVLRRLRAKSIEVSWSHSLMPISEDGFRESHASDRYFCFMDQCDKQKSAIGDHDVFEYPMGNRTPQELTP